MITLAIIAELIHRETRGSVPRGFNLDENSRLGDLGLNSLQIVEIVFVLEDRVGRELDQQRMADVETIGDLLTLVNETTHESSGATTN